jgi:DNA-binding beta-propeller fold protein YncE
MRVIRSRRLGVVATLVLILVSSASSLGASLPAVCLTRKTHIVWKDIGKNAIHFLDRDSLRVISSLDLEAAPDSCFFDPSGRTLAMLTFGQASDRGEKHPLPWEDRLKAIAALSDAAPKAGHRAWHVTYLGLPAPSAEAKARTSALAVASLERREITATLRLPGGIRSAHLHPDGRTITCVWNADRDYSGRIAIVDLEHQEIAGSAVLPFTCPSVQYSADGTQLYAMRAEADPAANSKRSDAAPPDFLVLDPATGKTLRELHVGGRLTRSAAALPDREGLLVLAAALPRASSDWAKFDIVYRFTGSSPDAVDSTALGSAATDLLVAPQGGYVVVCGQDPVTRGTSTLCIFDRRGTARRIAIEDAGPCSVEFAGGDTAYVLAARSLTSVGLQQQSVLAHVVLPFPPAQLLVSRDATRGYVNELGGGKIAIVDFARASVLTTFTTNPTGVRGLGTAVTDALAYHNAQWIAERQTRRSGFESKLNSILGMPSGYTQMLMRPDEKRLYVLNTQTDQLNIVDTQTREILEHIGTGISAIGMHMSFDLGHAMLFGQSDLGLFDMTTGKVAFVRHTGNAAAEMSNLSCSWAFDESTWHVYALQGNLLYAVNLSDGVRTKLRMPSPVMGARVLIPAD